MKSLKILVIGACGQIGTELTIALRERYGKKNVLATDLFFSNQGEEPYRQLDVLNIVALEELVCKENITQIYLLADMLSVKGVQDSKEAWNLNMGGLLNVLKVAASRKLDKVFWPSSVAVFGLGAPKHACPQETQTEPETVYGISKRAGEYWCSYYFEKHGLDIRSIRFPGLISHSVMLDGGTTDYAVEIFHQALLRQSYTCYLQEDTCLPMVYMPDAIRAILELMESPAEQLKTRTSYNLSAMSFAPCDLAAAIRDIIPEFTISYIPDSRQTIAESRPSTINDMQARQDWNWKPHYNLKMMAIDMLEHLSQKTQQIPAGNWIHDDNYFFTRIDEA